MSVLFSLSGDEMRVLAPTSFPAEYLEVDLQRWVDTNPHFLNEGRPMLSLGREISTQHGHAIDNLFVDGNGCLVVAELKRGSCPLTVMAQLINYGAHISGLEWPDLDPLCLKRHGASLVEAFQGCFGRPLVQSGKPDHRMLVLAERYDQPVVDAALYLINNGTPLILLQFAHFEVNDTKLFEVRTVLGEIPEQPGPAAGAVTEVPDDGYGRWLFTSVAEKLREIAKRQGWELRYRINKQSLPFAPNAWPTVLTKCHLRLDIWRKDQVALRLGVRKEAVPGLWEFLEARRDEWRGAFPAEFVNPPYHTANADLFYSIPRPEVGDADALSDIVNRTDEMASVMVPLLNEYFRTRMGSDRRAPVEEGETGDVPPHR